MTDKTYTGKVVSNKMDKTVVVAVTRQFQHPVYKKTVKKVARFKAHDEKGCQMGDTVVIVESRPISKNKRWVVENILSRKLPVELPATSIVLDPKTLKAYAGEYGEDGLDEGQTFRNHYESTKFEAERLVRAAMAAGLPAGDPRVQIINLQHVFILRSPLN